MSTPRSGDPSGGRKNLGHFNSSPGSTPFLKRINSPLLVSSVLIKNRYYIEISGERTQTYSLPLVTKVTLTSSELPAASSTLPATTYVVSLPISLPLTGSKTTLVPSIFASQPTSVPSSRVSLSDCLATASPTDTSTGASFNEVADTFSYARVDVGAPINSDWTDPSAGSQGETDNAADITFTTAAGGSWGTITSVTILDNITHGAGNILFYGDLTTNKVVNDGDTFKFSTGDLNISLD